MAAEDLPIDSSLSLSFTGVDTIAQQLARVAPGQRQCIVTALTKLGMSSFLSPNAVPGVVPTFDQSPVMLLADCNGVNMTLSFVTTPGGANDDGNVAAYFSAY